jgi:glycerol-3-phosphate dehydrogenase (NAD(P)+)
VGVLKNIYAILMGVVGLWGGNARAALAAVTLGELKEVLHTLVPDEPCPFLSPAWTGDFLVTAFSGHSRNQRFGQLLAQGYSAPIALQKLGMVAEGYYAAQAIAHWPSYRDFPLLSLAIEALTGRSDPFALRETLLRVLSEKGTGEIA